MAGIAPGTFDTSPTQGFWQRFGQNLPGMLGSMNQSLNGRPGNMMGMGMGRPWQGSDANPIFGMRRHRKPVDGNMGAKPPVGDGVKKPESVGDAPMGDGPKFDTGPSTEMMAKSPIAPPMDTGPQSMAAAGGAPPMGGMIPGMPGMSNTMPGLPSMTGSMIPPAGGNMMQSQVMPQQQIGSPLFGNYQSTTPIGDSSVPNANMSPSINPNLVSMMTNPGNMRLFY